MATSYGEKILVRGRMKDRIYPNKTQSGKRNLKVYFGVPDNDNHWMDYAVTFWEDSVPDYEATVAYLDEIKEKQPWYFISGTKESFTSKNKDGEDVTRYEIKYPKFVPENAEDPLLKFVERKKGDTTAKMEEAAPRHQAPTGKLDPFMFDQLIFVNTEIVPGFLGGWRKQNYPEFEGRIADFTEEMATHFLKEYMERATEEGHIDSGLYDRYCDDMATLMRLVKEANAAKKAGDPTKFNQFRERLNKAEPKYPQDHPFTERVHLVSLQHLHKLREEVEKAFYPETAAADVL